MPQVKITRKGSYALIFSPTGNDSTAGRYRGAYASLSYIYTVAKNNDICFVQPGTYTTAYSLGSNTVNTNVTTIIPSGTINQSGSPIAYLIAVSKSNFARILGNADLVGTMWQSTSVGTYAPTSASILEVHANSITGSGTFDIGTCNLYVKKFIYGRLNASGTGLVNFTGPSPTQKATIHYATDVAVYASSGSAVVNISNARVIGTTYGITTAGNTTVNANNCEIWSTGGYAPVYAVNTSSGSDIINLNNCIIRTSGAANSITGGSTAYNTINLTGTIKADKPLASSAFTVTGALTLVASRLQVRTFTFSGSTLTVSSHPFGVGDTVRVYVNISTGTLPTPLVDGTIYYVGTVASGTFSLYNTLTDAQNQTNVISLSGGTGTFYIFSDGADINDTGNRYVDAARPSDNGDGLDARSAKQLIASGVTAGYSGNTVQVAAGAYTAMVLGTAANGFTFNLASGVTITQGGNYVVTAPAVAGYKCYITGHGSFSTHAIITTSASTAYDIYVHFDTVLNSTYSPFALGSGATGVVFDCENFTGNAAINSASLTFQARKLIGTGRMCASGTASNTCIINMNNTANYLNQGKFIVYSDIIYYPTASAACDVRNADIVQSFSGSGYFLISFNANMLYFTNCTLRTIYNKNLIGVLGGNSGTNGVYFSNCRIGAAAISSVATWSYIGGSDTPSVNLKLALWPYTISGTVLTTPAAHPFATADGVQAYNTSTTGLNSPLVADTAYYVRVLTTTTLQLHLTASDATNNLNPISLTAGTGTQFITGL